MDTCCSNCNESFGLISCDNGDVVCRFCGRIHCYDNIRDDTSGIAGDWIRRWTIRIPYAEYTKRYFEEVVANLSKNYELLSRIPEDILEFIYDSLETDEYKNQKIAFKRMPTKKNTRSIFKHVKVGKRNKRLSEKYISKKTKLPLVSLERRKNFTVKWMQLKVYLMERYGMPIDFELFSYDIYDILVKTQASVSFHYLELRRGSPLFFKRVAKPNAPVFITYLLLLLSPKCYLRYADIIELPKTFKTSKRSVEMIEELIDYNYGDNGVAILKTIMHDIAFEWHPNRDATVYEYISVRNPCVNFLRMQFFLYELEQVWKERVCRESDPLVPIIQSIYKGIQSLVQSFQLN